LPHSRYIPKMPSTSRFLGFALPATRPGICRKWRVSTFLTAGKLTCRSAGRGVQGTSTITMARRLRWRVESNQAPLEPSVRASLLSAGGALNGISDALRSYRAFRVLTGITTHADPGLPGLACPLQPKHLLPCIIITVYRHRAIGNGNRGEIGNRDRRDVF
jgi:hypothetical protein